MKHVLPLLLSVLFSIPVLAQDKVEDKKSDAKKEQPAKAEKKEDKKIEAKSKGPKAKVPYQFMANIHGGIGLMNYFGDLRDNPGTTVHRIGSHAGYNFGIGANVTNYLEVNINAMISKLSWNQNQKLHDVPQNFQAKSFAIGAELVYNFKNVILNPTGITPFISIGVGYADFDVYSDLQTTVTDANGNEQTYNYNYWAGADQRGVIYNQPEDNFNDDLRTIQRDFEYETRLNEYPIATYTIPVGVGFDFNANRNFALRLGAYYYFTGTDNMDNVEGGNTPLISNDGFIYTSMSLFFKFDPFKKKAPKVDEAGQDYADIGTLVYEDEDGDGVSDFYDKCGGTPKGLVVDDNGCPADGDGDGIPDYRDKELKTTPGRIVDPNGVAISYKDIYETYGKDTVSLMRKNVSQEWLFSQKSADPDYTVHVGTYTNYDIPTQIKLRLAKMEDLVEHKVNDSISVFTVGKFKSFEEAELRQNELIASGIDEAFGVNDEYIPEVGVDIGVVGFDKSSQRPPENGVDLDEIENVDVLQYGVELREYRLRIQLDRLSKLIAQHGVEMKTTEGGLKVYTIGAFSTLAEAEALQRQVESLGVKNPVISAKLNNQTIDIEEAQKKEAELQGE